MSRTDYPSGAGLGGGSLLLSSSQRGNGSFAAFPSATTRGGSGSGGGYGALAGLTAAEAADIADCFAIFSYRGHSGAMLVEDLGVAARVLGLELSREQQRGYAALFSTAALPAAIRATAGVSAILERAAAASAHGDGSDGSNAHTAALDVTLSPSLRFQHHLSSSGSFAGGVPSPMAGGDGHDDDGDVRDADGLRRQRYYSLRDFLEIVRDMRDGREAALRGGQGRAERPQALVSIRSRHADLGGSGAVDALEAVPAHRRRWIEEGFALLDPAGSGSVSAPGLLSLLERAAAAVNVPDARAVADDENDDDVPAGSFGSSLDDSGARAGERGGRAKGMRRSSGGGGSGLSAAIGFDVPSDADVAAAIADLVSDARIGLTLEDLLRAVGQSTSIM